MLITTKTTNLNRNDICYCGSGKKFKRCCINAKEKKAKEEKEFLDIKKRRQLIAIWIGFILGLIFYGYIIFRYGLESIIRYLSNLLN